MFTLLSLLLLIIIIVIISSSRSISNFRIQVLSMKSIWRFRRVVHKIDMAFNPSSKPKNAVLKCLLLLFHSLQMSVSTQCSPDGVLSPVCLSGSTNCNIPGKLCTNLIFLFSKSKSPSSYHLCAGSSWWNLRLKCIRRCLTRSCKSRAAAGRGPGRWLWAHRERKTEKTEGMVRMNHSN